MTDFGFDPTSYEPSKAFEVVPPAWYAVTISEAVMQPTKAGPDALKLTYEVDAAEHPDVGQRKLFDNLNINHSNEQPREISRRNLSAICQATGIQARNAEELLGGKLMVKAAVRPPQGEYPAQNVIKGYKPIGEAVSAPAAHAATVSAPASAAGRPWARK